MSKDEVQLYIALFLYLFGYGQANQKREEKTINAVKKAKKARNILNNTDRINRLHNKYKR